MDDPKRASRALELVDSRATPSEVTIQAYRLTGPPAVRKGHYRHEARDS